MKLKLSAQNVVIAGLLLALVLVAGVVVKAYQGDEAPKVVSENGTVNFYEAPEPATVIQEVEEQNIGAVTSPTEMGNLICANDDCTYYLQAPFNTSTTTLNGNLTVVSIPNPFLMTSSTYNQVTGVVLKTNGETGAGYRAWYGATSTVDLVRVSVADKTNSAPTSTWEIDCSSSVDGYTTSTSDILNTETRIPTSTIGIIESGMTSSTNLGLGSLVYDDNLTTQIVNKIVLTPSKPYLVCNIWQPYGTALDTFFGTWNTSTTQRVVNVRISRQKL